MPKYEDHTDVLNLLAAAQDTEHDLRIIVRETHHFLDKRDGQWEPEIWTKFKSFGRPRYTFDQCNPVVDQISGEMEQADFDIKVRPGDGDASEDVAKTIDGMIRNIENISNAKEVFNSAGRSMVAAGLDGWMVTQEWADGDSFDQDLFIRKIPNVVDRVWLDPSREMQSGMDAKYGFLLQVIPLAEYSETWPKGSRQSVSDDREAEVYSYKQSDVVIVGQLNYLKEVERELVQMDDGSVYVYDDDFKKVQDEKALQGIHIRLDDDGEPRIRTRITHVNMVRTFDGGGWLDDAKPTVFEYIPLVLTYGNFKISENKIIYRGAIEKLLDSQRILNYALSRDIEEGALAPRDKIWMTRKQAEGEIDKIKTMNTNADPVQFYNSDAGAPMGPYRPTAAQPNAGLQTTAMNMTQAIQQASGQPPVAKGDNPGLQSGIAISKLQAKSDTMTIKWFKSQEVAIQHTAQILIKAIPKVYDTFRKIRILGEDGTSSMIEVNKEEIVDRQTGEKIVINDLSRGKYDAICSAGPSFVSRQEETVHAMTEIANIDPSIMIEGGDVFLSNISSPGIDIIAARRRARMIKEGTIPQSEWTDDEIEQAEQEAQQAAQNAEGQPPTPEQMIGQAELMGAQTDAQNSEVDNQVKVANINQKQQDLDRKDMELQLKAHGSSMDEMIAQQKQQSELLTAAVNQMATIATAFGVDGMAGGGPAAIIAQQAAIVDEAQDQV